MKSSREPVYLLSIRPSNPALNNKAPEAHQVQRHPSQFGNSLKLFGHNFESDIFWLIVEELQGVTLTKILNARVCFVFGNVF